MMDGALPPAAASGEDPANRAIARMRSPRDMHIICVDVTNKCDLKCSNCTRLLANQSRFWDMSPDNFRQALRSLRGFTGVIAMIGGNPCMHKDFAELCRIFAEEVPVKRQRGLWSNNVFDHQELIRDTFGFFNLNPHNDARGIESLDKLKALIPAIEYYKGNSHHAPLMTAMKDLYPDEGEMWAKIEGCDINREWSASIVQNKGELRAYFCEVAASFDLARGGDHGAPVTEGWWKKGIGDYADQVKRFCPGCGVPARLKGTLDAEEIDSYTRSNADIATKTRRKRQTVEIDGAALDLRSERHVTDYSEQHMRAPEPAPLDGPPVSVVIPFYNGNDTIRETVLSALGQRDIDCEVILVDDCSAEDPREGLAELAETVTLLRNARNSGPATARNAGLARARGKYVCFLDADDVYADGFFAEAVGFLESHPEVMAVTSGVELIDCDRIVNLQYHACVVGSVPSNVIVRTEIARLIGGFPEDPAFRGPAAGEDTCFRTALGRFPTHHLPFPYLGHRMRPGSHFYRFLDSSEMREGHIVITRQTPAEADGSLGAAIQRYHQEVTRRIAARQIEAGGADHPLNAATFALGADFAPLRDRFAGLGDTPPAAEAYALHLWAAHGKGEGDVVQIGCGAGSLACWLAEGCRVGGRGKVAAVDPFPARSAAASLGSAYQRFLDILRDKGVAELASVHRGQPSGVAWTWKRPIRLLAIDAAAGLIRSRAALDEWLTHLEPDGAVAFHGFGVRPDTIRLYEEVVAEGRLREVFAMDGLRVLVAH